jgi:two-component system, OmpR family, sensor kinase
MRHRDPDDGASLPPHTPDSRTAPAPPGTGPLPPAATATAPVPQALPGPAALAGPAAAVPGPGTPPGPAALAGSAAAVRGAAACSLPVAAVALLTVGLAGRALAALGVLPDPPITLTVSAVAADWTLAATTLTSLLLLVTWWARHRSARRLGAAVAAQVAAATDDRRRFLGRLDHEMKNPIMAMRAAVANLADTPLSHEQSLALGTVADQALRLSRLTTELRKIADVERRPPQTRVIDVGPVIDEALEVVRENPAAESRRWHLDLPRAPWPLPRVAGDPELLCLALINLLDNAVKYTHETDAIEVRARESGRWLVIEVADTGPGIAETDLPHVWDEMYRATATSAVPGSGLGLALVRAVVEQHTGRVHLASRIGHGTAVQIWLPTAETP